MAKVDWLFKVGADPQGNSDGFWYGINEGYIKPDDVLIDKEQVRRVMDAAEILHSFELALEDAGLLEDM